MIHPTPSGTRDVLPDEMRELRAINARLLAAFDSHGYGEIATPALEYEAVIEQGDGADARPAYRLFDEHGDVLVLRSDMTIPIARVVGERYPEAPLPLRFCYLAHCYRGVRPRRGQPREFLQAGVELIGAGSPAGTVEVLALLCAALDAAGLRDYRVGLGDAALYDGLLEAFAVPQAAREAILAELVTRDFVGLEREVASADLGQDAADALVRVPQMRGEAAILDAVPAAAVEPVSRLRRVREQLAPKVAERVIFDLGLVRGLGYYTGAVFEVYAPALGMPLGGGGRYDELLERFGRPLPAVGFALNVEALHLAVTGEERG